VRRLTEAEALDLIRPPTAPAPKAPPQPDTPHGWLAQLVGLFTTLIRRV
jgi:hypothetical protein